MKTLYTRWGKELDPEHVLSEYPRPMMRRKSYVNLNGYWDYRICKEMKRRPPASYEGQILVPFSPESPSEQKTWTKGDALVSPYF